MTFDAIAALQEIGTPTDMLSDDQRRVLSRLTPDEVAVWKSIKERLDAAGGGEVAGHDLNLML